jgi:hypothetical protein
LRRRALFYAHPGDLRKADGAEHRCCASGEATCDVTCDPSDLLGLLSDYDQDRNGPGTARRKHDGVRRMAPIRPRQPQRETGQRAFAETLDRDLGTYPTALRGRITAVIRFELAPEQAGVRDDGLQQGRLPAFGPEQPYASWGRAVRGEAGRNRFGLDTAFGDPAADGQGDPVRPGGEARNGWREGVICQAVELGASARGEKSQSGSRAKQNAPLLDRSRAPRHASASFRAGSERRKIFHVP